MSQRENALQEWLNSILSQHPFSLNQLTGDASFRRYFRVQNGDKRYIVMDAPPDKENIDTFVDVARRLTTGQMNVPHIHHINKEQGFLLLSDLGDQLLLDKLDERSANHYYLDALNDLLRMQHCSTSEPSLPVFNQEFMLKEMNLCTEWFF